MIDLKSVSRKGKKMKKKSIFLKSMHTIWIHYAEFISSNDLNLLMGACIRRRIFKFEDSWWQVIGDRWQITQDMWHVTLDTWHMTFFGIFFALLFFFSFYCCFYPFTSQYSMLPIWRICWAFAFFCQSSQFQTEFWTVFLVSYLLHCVLSF